MCRSSRTLAFVCLFATTPVFAQARGGLGHAGIGGAPISLAAPRALVRPGIMPGLNPGVIPNVQSGVTPGVRPNVFPNVRSGVQPGLNRGYGINTLRPGVSRGYGINTLQPGFSRGYGINALQPRFNRGYGITLQPRFNRGYGIDTLQPRFSRGYGIGAVQPRFGRGRRFGGGGSGLDATDLGLSTAGDLPYTPFGGYGYDEQGLPVIPAIDPTSCARPLILKVGRGLRHPPKTRVVYGTPPGCGRFDQR